MRHRYSEKEENFLKDNAKGMYLKELTERFNEKFNLNLTESAVRNIKNKLKLKSGLIGGKKGHIGPNKGKKVSTEQYERLRPTMYKKGNIPSNAKPLGSEKVDERGYVLTKVQNGKLKNNWVKKHRFIYEKAYGRIPEGHRVIFADDNKRNFELDNFILISQDEYLIMKKRGLYSKNPDFTKTGVIIAKVLDKIYKRR